MEQSLKKKLRFVIIAFCILLIPSGFLLKHLYGVSLNDSAVDLFWQKNYCDREAGMESIKMLERAKKFCGRNKFVYINQSRIQSILGDNKSAIKSIGELLDFQPENIYAIRLQGFYYELDGQMTKAIENYKKVKKLTIENNSEHEDFKLSLLIANLLLSDTTGLSNEIKELKVKYNDDQMREMIIESLTNFDRRKFIKQQIQ